MEFYVPVDRVNLYEEGFADDLLGRIKTGEALSELLERIDSPLVIALDGRWGTGKSYFLKRWVGAHRLDHKGRALTIYFDAFANDYQSDPLAALVAALADRTPANKDDAMKRVQRAAFRFIKPLARVGLSLATFGATKALDEIGDAVVEAVGKETEASLEAFWQHEEGRRAAMEEFRAALSDLQDPGKEGEDQIPLVIIIDELDRCRPDYALEVLEVIKHFFAVPKVHFILGVNLVALQNSVMVRYGNGIDAAAYLRKFINITLTLPETVPARRDMKAIIAFAESASDEMGLPKVFRQRLTSQIKVISRNAHISIREVGRILSAASLLSDELLGEERILEGYRTIAITLLIVQIIRPDLFSKFLSAQLSEDEVIDFFGASQRFTEYEVGGNHNPQRDQDTVYLASAWLHIVSAGSNITERHGFYIAEIGRAFDQFGRHHDPSSVPKTTFTRWMDTFKIT
ncbi:P-loop NTPase fold protein [Falsirhodobacter algicola]|uniref:KAP NTPase domain-containing protein n=1 Tax=Falsirhodobacter algicola TaxID=2692330 RepID=A0A8J8SLG0_9RHOB|nr:P-loop NTPase fold protein [Falsirhodobacter algicola]QUS36374.1 hypothetical protein GR316_08890 [Falsirhodobacter algicola]